MLKTVTDNSQFHRKLFPLGLTLAMSILEESFNPTGNSFLWDWELQSHRKFPVGLGIAIPQEIVSCGIENGNSNPTGNSFLWD